MFEDLKLVVSIVDNEVPKESLNSLCCQVEREGVNTLTLHIDQVEAFSSQQSNTLTLQHEQSSSNFNPQPPFKKFSKEYKFEHIVGPKSDGLDLHAKLRSDDLDETGLNTIISVSRFYPTIVEVRDFTSTKGQLPYFLSDMLASTDQEDTSAVFQVSCFSFVNGTLVNLLQTDKTQLLFNFELNYSEFGRNQSQAIYAYLREAIRKAAAQYPDVRLTFYYLVLRTNKGPQKQCYLLGDFFRPFEKKKLGAMTASDLNWNSQVKKERCKCCDGKVCSLAARYDAEVGYHTELLTLQKYICFETPHRLIAQEEQANSIDIFFNELVQERNNRAVIHVKVPRYNRFGPDSEVLLEFASQIEKSASIFNSYLFQLLHSQTRQTLPIRLTQIDELQESRIEESQRPRTMRRSSVFSSARKSMSNLIQQHKLGREGGDHQERSPPKKMDVESQQQKPLSTGHNLKASTSYGAGREPQLNPFSRLITGDQILKSASQPEAGSGRFGFEAESSLHSKSAFQQQSSSLGPPSSRPLQDGHFPGQQEGPGQLRQPLPGKTAAQQAIDLQALTELSQLDMSDPRNVEKVVLKTLEQMDGRSAQREIFCEFQNQLLNEYIEMSQIKFSTYKQSISTLNSMLKSAQTQSDYLRYLMKCIGEFRQLRDPSKKSQIVQAIQDNCTHLESTVIEGLLELLKEEPTNSKSIHSE